MPDVATFVAVPTLRCHELVDHSPRAVCGVKAEWMRPGSHELPVGYFCSQHRASTDVRIPESFLFRRVSVTLDVLFAGASMAQALSQAEVVDRLERVIESAGGLINLHTVTSAVGRYSPPAPSGRRKRTRA